MGRAGSALRLVAASALGLGLGLVAGQPASGAARHAIRHTPTTALWTPSNAPLPATLPDGNPPQASVLYSTSCSSVSFCVAVGNVASTGGGSYPLVETYSSGVWTPSTAPVPSDAVVESDGEPGLGILMSVSCPSDGNCAAAGLYLATGIKDGQTVGFQTPLLEVLANGAWSATAGTFPSNQTLASANNVWSVSCGATGSCMAVASDGGQIAGGGPNAPGDWEALIYILDNGTWQLQPQPPLPANYQDDLVLSSVSCPDASDCIVVGSYGEPGNPPSVPDTQYGLILTYAAGTWTTLEAQLPSNAATLQEGAGLNMLDAVDCVDATDCVAGGAYFDTSQDQPNGWSGDLVPLIETLSLNQNSKSPEWTPSEGPVPSDAAADPLGIIQGISCPALGSCVADGSYWMTPGWPTGVQNGMLLSQSSTGWTAADAPLPVTSSTQITHAKKHSRPVATLSGISCVKKTSFCRAVGKAGKHGLIEKSKRR
jgi:hypothetical protein